MKRLTIEFSQCVSYKLLWLVSKGWSHLISAGSFIQGAFPFYMYGINKIIILWYLGRIICSIHKKIQIFNPSLWIAMLTMLTPFCKKWMKMKTNSKNTIILHGVLLCVLLSRKVINRTFLLELDYNCHKKLLYAQSATYAFFVYRHLFPTNRHLFI